jgi:hypothetical protein
MLGALLAVSFPVIWLVHGAVNHESALFFVTRVVEYKEAYGDGGSLADALFVYPRALITSEPEVSAAFLSSIVLLNWPHPSRFTPRFPKRAAFVFLAVLGLLIVGAARGGAPTHHPERALLSCWLFFPVAVASLMSQSRNQKTARMLFAIPFMAAALGNTARIFGVIGSPEFPDRKTEERIGAYIRDHLDATERVALSLPDYGYLSVMAAGENPARFVILESHDPRAKPKREPLTLKLERFLASGGCYWVSSESLSPHSARVFHDDDLALFRLKDCD